MARPGPWTRDATRRRLAVDLGGAPVADRLQELANEVVNEIDVGVATSAEDRRTCLVFFALCIGGHLDWKPEDG